MNLKTRITKIHYDKGVCGVLFRLLEFCSLFYAIGSGLKNFFYDRGILKPQGVGAFVVSVGNITTGGVGKTPVVAEIAKYFLSAGERTAIISRGYGGELSNKNINVISDGEKIYYHAQEAGDEPYWLAQSVPGAVVITSKNRVAAARCAVENYGVTRIVLDDGFQHRKLYRDLDVVLIDGKMGLGNGHQLPAGPLRESKKSLVRADKIVELNKRAGGVYNIRTGAGLQPGALVTAGCAIGQPQSFYDLLSGYDVIETVTFDDHHSYQLSDIEGISGDIITTEKDAVKLQKFGKDNIYALKLQVDINVGELFEAVK
jgi:tetraacyldisaccharide 4'-kinase